MRLCSGLMCLDRKEDLRGLACPACLPKLLTCNGPEMPAVSRLLALFCLAISAFRAVLPGSPKKLIKPDYCAVILKRPCNIMQDFPAFVREHVKNTGTKPVQAYLKGAGSPRCREKKNPRPAATETGIKSITKASSFLSKNSTDFRSSATIGLPCSPHNEVLP